MKISLLVAKGRLIWLGPWLVAFGVGFASTACLWYLKSLLLGMCYCIQLSEAHILISVYDIQDISVLLDWLVHYVLFLGRR
jgi:hypothetical protein